MPLLACSRMHLDGCNVSDMNVTHLVVAGEGGVSRLYSGVGPRTMWISIGGYVFFGAYEAAKTLFTKWGI
jgi:hypothetical protein